MSETAAIPATADLTVTASAAQPVEAAATYRDVFAVREFRYLFGADLVSLLGDQVAAVGLAFLLYQRSGSALLAALGYATAYVPWTIGGPLLAAWADRRPGRQVMVSCDLGRAAAIGVAALPGMPLPVIALLVLAAAMLAPPFDSARSALLPQILLGDRYAVAVSIRDAVHQSAQLAGFLGGGALVVLIGARGALMLDAVSFAGSAALLRFGIRHRPAALDLDAQQSLLAEAVEGLRVVAGDRRLYGPLLLSAVGVAYVIVPEGIAPAYASALGHGATAVGAIMAGVAAGSVIGAVLYGRFVSPSRRRSLMWPLALIGTAPLVLVGLRPGLAVSLVLFALAGVASTFNVAANAAFAAAAPAAARGRAFGVAMSGIYAAQVLGVVLAGAAAQIFAPSTVVAGAGVLGAAGVLVLRRTVRN
jgi:predicted MFS family arabinose efflux permease